MNAREKAKQRYEAAIAEHERRYEADPIYRALLDVMTEQRWFAWRHPMIPRDTARVASLLDAFEAAGLALVPARDGATV